MPTRIRVHAPAAPGAPALASDARAHRLTRLARALRAGLALALALALSACADAPPIAATPPSSATASASGAASSAPSAQHVVKLADADAGKTISAKVGDTVALTLETNPSTGYDWQVDKVDKTLGQPKVTRPEGPGPEGKVGAPSTVTFTWTLAGPSELAGDHAVELAYRRPWEKDDPPERTFKFTLRVGR